MDSKEASRAEPVTFAHCKRSIIIPAYAEEEVIGSSLDAVVVFLAEQGWTEDTEIIVVTADSPDLTAEMVRSKARLFKRFQFIEPGKRVGKGRDVRAGMQAAHGELLLFMDADLATPLSHVAPAFEKLEAGADVVIGVRNLWVMHKSFLRKLSSVGANWLTRLLLMPTVPDTQCGFKAFRRPAAEALFGRLTILGWGFDMELLLIAKKHHLKIKKLPIKDWHDPKAFNGLVGDSTLKAIWRTTMELLKIRWQGWKGMYK